MGGPRAETVPRRIALTNVEVETYAHDADVGADAVAHALWRFPSFPKAKRGRAE